MNDEEDFLPVSFFMLFLFLQTITKIATFFLVKRSYFTDFSLNFRANIHVLGFKQLRFIIM